MRIAILALVIACSGLGSTPAAGETLQMLPFDPGTLPREAAYQGKLVAGARWLDKNGENLVILSETGIRQDPRSRRGDEDSTWSGEVFGYHYLKQGDRLHLNWKVYDHIKKCPFDITVQLLPESLAVTDLDHNGVAEVSFIYRLRCAGDVSPATQKLIMYEGKNKYAVRGDSLVIVGPTERYGGQWVADPAYRQGPDIFREFSIKRWEAFMEEKL